MLFVRTRLKPSSIEGIGLFAAERIGVGQTIWAFTPGLDSSFPLDSLRSLAPIVQDFLNKYCSLDRERRFPIIYADDARFMNHSSHPNTRLDENAGILVAAADINEGDEITENYCLVEWNGRDLTSRWAQPKQRKNVGQGATNKICAYKSCRVPQG